MTKGFEGSVVSYPDRGSDGNASYRGNTTGYIIEDFLRTVHRDEHGLFVDPMVGGGTSRDVATRLTESDPSFRNLSENFRGFDLRDGFDASSDDLLTALGRPAHSFFLHPPYSRMITYSGPAGMWGTEQHAADLSGCDVDEFLFRLQAVLQNVYQALEPGGHYGLLLGSWRNAGRYYHLPAMILPLCPGSLQSEIIKVQHNCTSDRKTYSGSTFVPIRHETLLVFRREEDGTTVYIAMETLERLDRYVNTTWSNLVHSSFRRGEVKTLKELYATLRHHPKAQNTCHSDAKIRQCVQSDKRLHRLAPGKYMRVS